MASNELRMSFADLAALQTEVAHNLRYGRAFVAGAADLPVLSDCALVLVHPVAGSELRLSAQVVMVSAQGPARGTGVALQPFNAEVLAAIERFAAEAPVSEAQAATVAEEARPPDGVEETAECASAEPAVIEAGAAGTGEPAPAEVEEPVAGEAVAEEHAAETPGEEEASGSLPSEAQLQSRQEKLRHLSIIEQQKLARYGELTDRVALERLFGKQVWEQLLRNQRITVPEIARIGRKHTLPRPLIDIIMDNSTWIKTAHVRRSLLSNPKLGSKDIEKLLRFTPKHELKLMEKGTAYSIQVRDAAKKLLRKELG